MKCARCGSPLGAGARSCSRCGEPAGSSTAGRSRLLAWAALGGASLAFGAVLCACVDGAPPAAEVRAPQPAPPTGPPATLPPSPSPAARLHPTTTATAKDLTAFRAAEIEFASNAGGFFGTPGCILNPNPCLQRNVGALLAEPLVDTYRNEHMSVFHGGPAPTPEEEAHALLQAPPGTMSRWSVIAVPAGDRAGRPSLCVDDQRPVCAQSDGDITLEKGRCPASCLALQP